MVLHEVTDELRMMFDGARRVTVLTGAGISAESGVPTFRGGGGAEIWTWRGRPVTELSSAELMRTDPKLVWEWFDYRRGMLATVAPNAGHDALARWGPRFEAFTLITQNIDDPHRRPVFCHRHLGGGLSGGRLAGRRQAGGGAGHRNQPGDDRYFVARRLHAARQGGRSAAAIPEGARLMRTLYFDCFAGASGDMILGALIDAGADLDQLRAQLASLGLSGYRVSTARVQRRGIAATK